MLSQWLIDHLHQLDLWQPDGSPKTPSSINRILERIGYTWEERREIRAAIRRDQKRRPPTEGARGRMLVPIGKM